MSNSVRKRKSIEHWKIIAFYLIIYDIVAINFSYFFGLLLRFDLAYSSIPENYLSAFLRFAPFYTAFSLMALRKLYRAEPHFCGNDGHNSISGSRNHDIL